MGEARRRASQGRPPLQRKPDPKEAERFIAWLPLTRAQGAQFVDITTRGAWIGIGALVVLWIVVRFIGPAAGWWTLADMP